jgi:hypothetical protein
MSKMYEVKRYKGSSVSQEQSTKIFTSSPLWKKRWKSAWEQFLHNESLNYSPDTSLMNLVSSFYATVFPFDGQGTKNSGYGSDSLLRWCTSQTIESSIYFPHSCQIENLPVSWNNVSVACFETVSLLCFSHHKSFTAPVSFIFVTLPK